MKISITTTLRKDRIGKDGTAPINLRFTQNRKSKYISIGIAVRAENWDDENKCLISNYPDYNDHQLKLANTIAEYEKKIKRLEILEVEVTFDTLLNQDSRKTPNQTILSYFTKLITSRLSIGYFKVCTKYGHFCRILRFTYGMNLISIINK